MFFMLQYFLFDYADSESFYYIRDFDQMILKIEVKLK